MAFVRQDLVKLNESLALWVKLCEQSLRGKEGKQAKDRETVNVWFSSSCPHIALFPTDRGGERGVDGRACLHRVRLPLIGCVPLAVEFQFGIRDKHVCTHGKVHHFLIATVLNQF